LNDLSSFTRSSPTMKREEGEKRDRGGKGQYTEVSPDAKKKQLRVLGGGGHGWTVCPVSRSSQEGKGERKWQKGSYKGRKGNPEVTT